MIFHRLNLLAKKIFPEWIYGFLIGKWDPQGFKKYFHNTNWLFISHAVTFVSSFLIFAVVARYLGPENLGKLNYAQSLVAIFSIFAGLGIDQILKRDLIANPEKENEIIGTAILSKLLFGSLTFIVLVLTAITIETDPVLTLLIAISGFTFILNPIGVLGILFDSKVASKYNAYITITTATVLPLVKILIIVFDKGIIYFALTLLLEAIIAGIILVYVYKKVYKKSIKSLSFNFGILKQLLKDSWPLLLAGLSATIYSRIDQVMIQHLLNSTSVGLYAGATKITTIVQTFPGIIIVSLFPAIINAKKLNYEKYLDRLKSLMIFSGGFVTLLIVPIVILAPIIINIILGDQFVDSVSVLRIHLWTSLGIILVAIIQNYLIAENLGKIFFIATLIGAVINIILNIILIPIFGINGAAMATFISYLLTIFSILLFKKPRKDLKYAILKK